MLAWREDHLARIEIAKLERRQKVAKVSLGVIIYGRIFEAAK